MKTTIAATTTTATITYSVVLEDAAGGGTGAGSFGPVGRLLLWARASAVKTQDEAAADRCCFRFMGMGEL